MRRADWMEDEEAGSQLLTLGPVALHVKEETGDGKPAAVSRGLPSRCH